MKDRTDTKDMRAPARPWLAAAALALVLAHGAPAAAQERPSPEDTARLLLGPVYLNPTFTVRDIGTDSNIFNDSTQPVEDVSATLRPEVSGGLRLGGARVTFGTAVGLVFFRRYTEENSVNLEQRVMVDVPLSRITPFAGVDYVTTRARPGFEIDARARRREPTVRLGTELRLSDLTSVTVAVRRSDVDFAEGASFLGASLRESLNRRTDAATGALRVLLTPLTTLVLTSEAERTRFDFSPGRDSNGVRVTAGFEFQPDALLGGTVSVGYRRFESLAADVPAYQGLAAALSLQYVLRGTTRIEGRFDRDVAYSVEESTPYYLSTGGSVTASQQVFGPVDVTGTLGRHLLAYQARTGVGGPDRHDVVSQYGGGAGVRIGQAVRIGLNVEYTNRSSNTAFGRIYDRRRVFASVTYGL